MTSMSVESTRTVMRAYVEALQARGEYGRYFSDDVAFELMGSGQRTSGPQAAEGTIRWLHEQAFAARPELKNLFVEEGKAAIEARFVGKHTGEFAGKAATGNEVDVPYSVIYDLAGDKITALRIYMPMDVLMGQIGF